jgi:hypothetical protein
MPAYAPKIARRVVRLMLAAILLLNTAAIGAMELQSSLLSPSGEASTPCLMVGEMDGHHDEERMSSTTRFPLTGTDPVPQYGPPLYKPPRA